MKTSCQHLHFQASKLPRLSQELIGTTLPTNGLYFVFEKGEFSHSEERIVRIGTHTGEGNLQKRIREHLYTPNKDRSVFRKHIGRCILAKRNDPFLEHWEKDLTSTRAREKHQHLIDFDIQAHIEDEVTAYITACMSFSVLKIDQKQQRLSAEEALLSTLAQCPDCHASRHWLGRFHPRQTFRGLGLWNVQGLCGEVISVSGVSNIFGA
ncbi:hypothetical protein ACK6D9_01385 [Hoeflea sp. Naph1]|uniref:hypothetical protein n=1 Tax=Hoeflea sp. Naph1 TaxID=3388653 RepID=UPI0039902AB3